MSDVLPATEANIDALQRFRLGSDVVARRRFKGHFPINPERVRGLEPDHAALREKRTLFTSTVVDAASSDRLLVSGFNHRKIGDRVVKGAWAGFPIYVLTLEERATCPDTCHHWSTCMGNGMPRARRHRHGAELELRLRGELEDLQGTHPRGFVVRLHALGDFYSTKYVRDWAGFLDEFPALHCFGYTAWQAGTEIGDAVIRLREARWDRFAIRTSSPRSLATGSTTLWSMPTNSVVPEGTVCPAQFHPKGDKAAAATCCGSCGLCWAAPAKQKTIAFVAHGGFGHKKADDDQPAEPPPPAANPAGPKPQLGWLPVARLSVDARYQRTLEGRRSQRLIELIVERFNWSAFQAIVATETAQGWLIIDGQHRVEAARRRGEDHVPAIIVKALSVAEQAAIFVSANQNRVAVNPFALHFAALAAGDTKAKALQQLCDDAAITLPRNPVMSKRMPTGQTMAIGALARILRRYGPDKALLAAKNINAAWGHYPGAMQATIFKAVAALIDADRDPAEMARRIYAMLRAKKPAEFYSEVASEAEVMEISEAMAAERVIKRLLSPVAGQATPEQPIAQRVVERRAHAEDLNVRPRIERDPRDMVTPSMMSDAERLRLMVRQGAPVSRIIAAFKISKAEALRRIADCS